MKIEMKFIVGLIAVLNINLAFAGNLQIDTDLTLQHTSNVGLAESNQDIFSDNILSLNAVVSQNYRPSSSSSFKLKAKLQHDEFARFNDLSHTFFGLGAQYKIQPVIGYYQPWLSFGLNTEQHFYRDSDIREGTLYVVDMSLHKRLSEQVSSQIGLAYERRFADETDVFEWERKSLFIAGQYQWLPNLSAHARYQYQHGDQVFVATRSPLFKDVAEAIADDATFGTRRAYRLNAHANTISLGLSYKYDAFNKLAVDLQHAKIGATGNHQYDVTQTSITWLHRF